MRVCFVSNGFGEDRSAALVAARLAALPGVIVAGAPLLSDGRDYRERGVPVLVRGWMPASGGFSTLTMANVLADLPVVPHVARFHARLAERRHDIDAVVVVGDVFLLMLARLALARPPVFIATAKSDYHLPHSRIECSILRRVPRVVITRDDRTRASLEARSIRARFFGNLLMDGLEPSEARGNGVPTVVMLPGSRREAVDNLSRMLDVVTQVSAGARWTCALAPSVALDMVRPVVARAGWRLDGASLVRENHVVELLEGGFERAVADADVALGMAGTANEQAAGLGRPVVSFPGAGPQASVKRLRQQAALLGGAAILVEQGGSAAVAAAVTRLVLDRAERERRGGIGRARMGPPGADAIARFLAGEFQLCEAGAS